ncbi:MAG: molybdenum cofactor biosysynthesis protein [Rhodobacterales bacterium]|nr:MAG: molybdenum cofactor biosysynthesis protein [Rhodobacterales bacterium]
MSAYLAEIWRHPIKSCGRETLTRVLLTENRTLPWDRRWAIAHEVSRFDPDNPEWMPCANFARAAKAPEMQAITASCQMDYGTVTLSHPKLPDLTIDPDKRKDAEELIRWLLPLSPTNRALPSQLVRNGLRGMTDTDYPSISIINLESHRAVEAKLGRLISPGRWRPNLILDGLAPWAERDWIGKRIRVGLAELDVREHITRCAATNASVATGQRDTDMLGTLEANWGHQEFGVYAVVTKTGGITQADTVEVIG